MTRGGQTGLAPAVGSGWAVRPAQSKASVSIATERITQARMLELAQLAARRVDDTRARIQCGERAVTRTEFTVRDLVRSDDAELMRFEVLVERAAGRTTARTQILSYQVKEGIGALVPVVHRKLLGFSAYEAFMKAYAELAEGEDRRAWVSHNSGK